MDGLRARFIARCLDDLEFLQAPSAPLTHETDHTLRDRIRKLAHRLAGAAATFGYPELSAAAQGLEDACLTGPEGRALREAAEPVVALITRLGAAAR